MSKKQKHIIIIGAGIIGLSTAYYLVQEGYKVTILEKSTNKEGCSYGNAGMIVPSHFIPLATPGIIPKGIKWLFNPGSPFYIKPTIDPRLISWLWKFYKSSTHRHVQESLSILSELNLYSRNLYEELSHVLDFGFESKGLLMLTNTKKGLQENIDIVALSRQTRIIAEVLLPTDIEKLQPGIQLDINGGVFFKQDAHINPGVFMNKLSSYLEANGVDIVYGAGVKKIIVENNKIQLILTANNEYKADEFVLSAGAWSSEIIEDLKIKLPLIAGKGYSMTLANPIKQLSVPTILSEGKVAITPIGKNLRFGGTMELTGINLQIKRKRVNGMIKSISNYLPDFKPTEFENQKIWAGLRPTSFDGLPFIGRFNKYPNLIAATGHSMMGISLAPITGHIVEGIVSGKAPIFDFSKISPNR